MPLLTELADMVHQNAVNHGWWDEERSIYEILDLIHSEWSEALEEARSNSPMVYKFRVLEGNFGTTITPDDVEYANVNSKPEGIAVELMDGVIRILDLFGRYKIEFTNIDSKRPTEFCELWENKLTQIETPDDLAQLLYLLHVYTSMSLMFDSEEEAENEEDKPNHIAQSLYTAMCFAVTWIHMNGIDPLELLMEKHEYNIGRPYKHGKQF